jgi:drug/metabolite transporter (DMT)-like permease
MHTLFMAQTVCAFSLPLQKYLLAYSAPLFLTGIRMCVAGIILLIYSVWSGFQWRAISKEQWRIYIIGILSGGYLKYVLKMWAIAFVPVGRVALLCTLSPFCTASFSYVSFSEQLSLVQWLGMSIGSIGIFLTMYDPLYLSQSFFSFLPCCLADSAIFGAVIAHCFGMISTRTAIKEFNHPSTVVSSVRMIGGGVLVLLTSVLIEGWLPVYQWAPFIGGLLAIVCISNIAGHQLYLLSYRYYSPTFISLTDGMSPLLVAFYGWFLLSEPITMRYCISAFIIMMGLALFYYHKVISTFYKRTLILGLGNRV